MKTKNDLSRITVDISKSEKAPEITNPLTLSGVETCSRFDLNYSPHPNNETLKALSDAQKGKNLIKTKDIEDLFAKLGI